MMMLSTEFAPSAVYLASTDVAKEKMSVVLVGCYTHIKGLSWLSDEKYRVKYKSYKADDALQAVVSLLHLADDVLQAIVEL